NVAIPLLPRITDKSLKVRRPLVPGMYGTMRLLLRKFEDTYLLPSSAVISRGGKRYVMEIKDHKAVLTPVRGQVDDGRLTKVVVVTRPGQTGEPEEVRDLTGDEEIVLHGQGQIGEGQTVHTKAVDW